jgi:hypothetical protein
MPFEFNLGVEVLPKESGQEKETKVPHQKRRSKIISICRWHDSILDNNKDSTKHYEV